MFGLEKSNEDQLGPFRYVYLVLESYTEGELGLPRLSHSCASAEELRYEVEKIKAELDTMVNRAARLFQA